MKMKAFAPYSVNHLTVGTVNDPYTGVGKLCRDGKTVARLFGVGNGRFVETSFSTAADEDSFNAYVSELDTQFLTDNIQAIELGEAIPTTDAERRGIILEALIEAAIDDIELHGRCRHNTLYRLKDDPRHQYRVWKVPFTPKVRAAIVRDHGEHIETILNDTMGMKTCRV